MASEVQNTTLAPNERFANLFKAGEAALNGLRSKPLFAVRKAAIERLAEMEFPTRRHEDWKYTSLNKVLQPAYQESTSNNLSATDIEAFKVNGIDAYTLVFVNGQFQKDWSNFSDLQEGLSILTLEEALQNEGWKAKVEEHFSNWATQATASFEALNTAFAKHAFFVHVAKNKAIDKPIHLMNISVGEDQDVIANLQCNFIVEQSSQLNVIETFHHQGENGSVQFSNSVNRFWVGANAHAAHYRIQQEDQANFLVNSTEAYQQQDSTFTNLTLDLGGRIVRNNLSVILQGQGTSTNMYGVYAAEGNQHMDNQTFIDHALPHCNSNEFYKGIIQDKGTGVFNGKVLVRQDAQKTNAFQQNSSLVLSKTATMDSKPQLEIFADDVRCSHGATIGQLDEDSVYYLRSRGLNDQQARSLLQVAFLKEVTENIELDAVRELADALIEAKLNQ